MRRLVPALVVALAVTLSACGSGSDGSSAPDATGVSATKLIASSADKAAAAKTARISGEVTVEVRGERKTMPIDGALDFRTGAFEFGYDMSSLGVPGGQDAKIQARMVDGTMYMSFGDLLAGELGEGLSSALGGKSWVKLDLASLGLGSTGAGGGLGDANPGGTLESLRGAGDVKRIGSEKVRGADTTHYRVTIDPEKALAEVPAEQRARVQENLGKLGGPIPVEVWIDGDGQARKITMNVDAAGAKVSTTIEYFDFGAKVDVNAPPADEVIDFSELFGGMLPNGAGTSPV
jgi:predicted small secreted protein